MYQLEIYILRLKIIIKTIKIFKIQQVNLISKSDKMDIDSQNFDAKRYVLNMIKQNTIKQLIRKNNQVDQQIKVHDHQIQSLVFQNYSKFISSIDTVRQMKDNICKVDDKLKVLQTSMDKIQQLALKIDATFSVKRKEIQKLDTINKDLQKLKNLCDFPNILKQDIAYYKSLPQAKIGLQAQKLFIKSTVAYESCYKTLSQLKQQPLISPIYKQSLDKVQNIRSILKALQVQYKSKIHCSILRNLTKKLLIITDDQVSILRIYFHSWKQRLGQTCFKGPRKLTAELTLAQPTRHLMSEITTAQIPEINDELWKQFVEEFRFVYKDIYPKLTISQEQINLHINNHMKDIFLWALTNYVEAAPMYCCSLKSYVYVTHIITGKIKEALNYLKQALQKDHHNKQIKDQHNNKQVKQQHHNKQAKQQNKVAKQLQDKMDQKLQNLGLIMFNFVFGKLKIYFILQMIRQKKQCASMQTKLFEQQVMKQSQSKILSPLKETLNSNFRIILDQIQHFKNIYELVFKSKQNYQQIIHKKIQQLIYFLSQIMCLPSTYLSQSIHSMINPSYNNKLNKIQKGIVQNVVKQLRQTKETGAWFAVVHLFLNLLNNLLGKRIIQSAQKNVDIPKNHDYGRVFNSTKLCQSKNLLNFSNYFANLTTNCNKFSEMILIIQNYMVLLNSMFAQNRRNIVKKPSFLTQQSNFAQQTQILTAKKLHLIQKKNPCERNSILTYFIRKVIKQILIKIRQSNKVYTENDIYNLVQICYELTNVEQESQICAFFYFIKANLPYQWKQSRQQLQEKYHQIRKDFVC